MTTAAAMPKRERLTLFAVHGLLASALTGSLMLVPLYLAHLGVTDPAALAGWSAASYGVGVAVSFFATPLWGSLGDRLGRRAMLLRAALGLALAQCLFVFATEPWHVVAIRAVQGGISGVGPALLAYAAARATRETVGRTLGLLESVSSAGSIIGPLAVSALAALAGYRAGFILSSSAAALAALLVLIFLTEAPKESEEDDEEEASLLGRLRRVAATPAVRQLLVLAVLIEIAHSAIELLYPVLLVQLTPDEAARALIAGWIEAVGEGTSLLFAPLLGRWSDRLGHLRMVRACVAATGLVTMLVPLVRWPFALLPIVAVSDGAAAGVQPGLYARLARLSPASQVGTVIALGGSAVRAGAVLGVALAAPLVAWVGVAGGFWAAGGWLLAVAAFGLRAKTPASELAAKEASHVRL